jgi:hypothetical protein
MEQSSRARNAPSGSQSIPFGQVGALKVRILSQLDGCLFNGRGFEDSDEQQCR